MRWNQVHARAARQLPRDPGFLPAGSRNLGLNEDRSRSFPSPEPRGSWVPFSHAPSGPLPAPSRPKSYPTNEEVRGRGRKPCRAQCLRRDRPILTQGDALTAAERSQPARYLPLPNLQRSATPSPRPHHGGIGRRLRDCGVPEGVKKFARAGRRGGGSTLRQEQAELLVPQPGKAFGRGGDCVPQRPNPEASLPIVSRARMQSPVRGVRAPPRRDGHEEAENHRAAGPKCPASCRRARALRSPRAGHTGKACSPEPGSARETGAGSFQRTFSSAPAARRGGANASLELQQVRFLSLRCPAQEPR